MEEFKKPFFYQEIVEGGHSSGADLKEQAKTFGIRIHLPVPQAHGLAEDNRGMTGVRIDKWLWATRFFKTRALAVKACELSRVEWNGQTAKPAREVRVGDLLSVKNDSGTFQIEVLQLSDIRGPAAVAQLLYRETDESKVLRAKAAEERKLTPNFEWSREGKPSKRDRRDLDRLRGRV